MGDRFREVAERLTHAVGTPWALAGAALVVLAWAATGPVFGFSNTWQLVINTGTTIVTFLMVFVIQASQNRDSRALHLKLDELLSATKGARNRIIDAEHEVEGEMERDERELRRRAHRGGS
ncbi:MAG TPA: low affinity iron permease family protein [Candidatus Limnocylindria bacterium]|jgi:low affinity Fe/Cu permease|nr:low affinity iron permease family protein [Candidatus Limnocylindria bacterium]